MTVCKLLRKVNDSRSSALRADKSSVHLAFVLAFNQSCSTDPIACKTLTITLAARLRESIEIATGVQS